MSNRLCCIGTLKNIYYKTKFKKLFLEKKLQKFYKIQINSFGNNRFVLSISIQKKQENNSLVKQVNTNEKKEVNDKKSNCEKQNKIHSFFVQKISRQSIQTITFRWF